tara:strand:+ start:194 stop:427 length:234 start_codon:yes stop_codon:yes gene_type:complete
MTLEDGFEVSTAVISGARSTLMQDNPPPIFLEGAQSLPLHAVALRPLRAQSGRKKEARVVRRRGEKKIFIMHLLNSW